MAVGGRSVFISYRRQLSETLALLVSKELTEHKFDTFMDVRNLDSGEFERTILSQIATREDFIVLLEPRSLERIGEEGDWLRREIAHALAYGRNIVPVTASGFEFRSDLTLPPDVAKLPLFNALSIQPGYFDEAMKRLRTRFLKTPPKPAAPPPSLREREAAEYVGFARHMRQVTSAALQEFDQNVRDINRGATKLQWPHLAEIGVINHQAAGRGPRDREVIEALWAFGSKLHDAMDKIRRGEDRETAALVAELQGDFEEAKAMRTHLVTLLFERVRDYGDALPGKPDDW